MAKADEHAIAKLAARQRGVVSVAQLHAAGFDTAAIKRRCRAGRLHRLHRGVYLVGLGVAPPLAAEMAGLLACGPDSVVSHRSAARLWGLLAPADPSSPVEITVPGRNPGYKPGILLYRAQRLERRDVRRVNGIPATAPARTLLDLATVLSANDVEHAYADALARGLLQSIELADVLDRNPGRRGAQVLRSLHTVALGTGLTRSEAERKMLALLRSAGLPKPMVNARVGPFQVDFFWPDERVIVEVDGYAYHADRASFERDRERDAMFVARGYVVLRVTWRQLTARRDALIARIAQALTVRSR